MIVVNRIRRAGLRLVMLVALASLPAVAAAQQDVADLKERAVRAAVERIAPSVLRIETFGGQERVGRLLVSTGPTTGLAVSEDGYILSSAFNFVQNPNSILVTMPSGKRAAATIVARDRSRMLVLLKVNSPEKLAPAVAVPRKEMVVGQTAIAVGRVYDGTGPNLSTGILSAKNRIWGKAIQTDAKVSPNNYGGPLIDLQGRVLGILVPMSPRGQTEVAGAEWYDSGIGFAAPLADILPHLDKMKQGQDLKPGLLGIALKGKNVFEDPAVIGAAQPNSPAAKAGLKAGDKIIEIEGQKIVRQAELKHALGGKYAGEKVKLVALRGSERLERTIELTDKLVPYEHPFLGVLPLRDATEQKGVAVRYVYPGSPADEAGLKAGDRLVKLKGVAIADAGTLCESLASHLPGESVKLTYERAGKPAEIEVKLARLPSDIPAKLPPALAKEPAKAEDLPPTGEITIKPPEEKSEALAYVPDNYHPDVAHGLIVWLHPAGGLKKQEWLDRWKPLCERERLIVLAPQSADKARWTPTEVAFVRKCIDELTDDYNIDSSRVVVHGYQAGGAMAFLVGFAHRDVVGGVAAVDSALPSRARPPANDPILRLAVYLASSEKSSQAQRIKASADQLEKMKYPVVTKSQGEQVRYLNSAELDELLRWVDSLDRI